MKRIIIFGIVAVTIFAAETLWLSARQPEISKTLALRQINGGTPAARNLREFEALKDSAHVMVGALIVMTAAACFGSDLRKGLAQLRQWLAQRQARNLSVLLVAALLLMGNEQNPQRRSQLRTWAWVSGGFMAFGVVLVVLAFVAVGSGSGGF